MENLEPGNYQNQETTVEDIKNNLFTRECPEEYEELIKGMRFIEQKTPYAENLAVAFYENRERKILSQLGDFVREKMKDKIVIDLGCGQTCDMSFFSRKVGSKLYIGADFYPHIFIPVANVMKAKRPLGLLLNSNYVEMAVDRTETEEERKKEEQEEADRIRKSPIFPNDFKYSKHDNALQVSGDMLRVISQIKDNSVGAIIISGIEIDSENHEVIDKYKKAIEKEIERVLTAGGIVMNYNSDIGPCMFNTKFKNINIRSSLNIKVFEKI